MNTQWLPRDDVGDSDIYSDVTLFFFFSVARYDVRIIFNYLFVVELNGRI